MGGHFDDMGQSHFIDSPKDQFKAQAKELLFVRPSSSPFLSFVEYKLGGGRRASLACLPHALPTGPRLLTEIYLIIHTFSFFKRKILALFPTKTALTALLQAYEIGLQKRDALTFIQSI
jgi:hypothetical protein